MAVKRRLCFIISILFYLMINGSCATNQPFKNQDVNKRINQKSDQPSTISKSEDQSPVDDILKDTFGLLDVIDQKLTSISNRTSSAMMRDNLRALDKEDVSDETLSKMASDFVSDRRSDTIDQITPVASEEVRVEKTAPAVGGDKKAKQLSLDDGYTESDPTDRHIKFTLDLMKSIFQSQSYKSETNSIESFLISPLSIQMVLMMMHIGAKGQTRREIGNCLHFGQINDKEKALAEFMLGQLQPNTVTNQGSSGSNKLRRRHQQVTNESKPQNSQDRNSNGNNNKKQYQTSGTLSPVSAHESFSSAVRNLLKDPIVMKAMTNANQIIVQKTLPLSPQFERAIKNYYGGDIKQVDFQNQPTDHYGNSSSLLPATAEQNRDIRQMVNEWVERQSKGRIVNLLTSPVSTSTLLMAINVLFFKGDWQYKFDTADTESDAWFTQANGNLVKVPMMVNKLPLAFAHDPVMKTSIIELPYKAQRLGLFLLLPDDVAGIFHTMQMLNSTSFANLISSMRRPTSSADAASNGINVRIPKFSIESSPKLSHILSQYLGLKTLFTPDSADLSGMFSPITHHQKKITNSTNVISSTTQNNHRPQVKLSLEDTTGQQPNLASVQVGLDELLHKAVLQIDEQGSVAAASSAAIVERVGLFNSNYFEADHPFLLFLMDKQTGLVLFSGVFAGEKGTSGTGRFTGPQSGHGS